MSLKFSSKEPIFVPEFHHDCQILLVSTQYSILASIHVFHLDSEPSKFGGQYTVVSYFILDLKIFFSTQSIKCNYHQSAKAK